MTDKGGTVMTGCRGRLWLLAA